MLKKLLLLGLIAAVSACGGINQVLAPAKEEVDPDKPNITLEDEKSAREDSIPDAELKVKKNFFFGEKTKKAFTAYRDRNTEDYRLFNVLPEPIQVDRYVQEIFYHNTERDAVTKVQGRGQTLARVLHGPYERLVNDVVVEKGQFIYGMKHGTWLYQRKDSTLYDKEHYVKGWLRDAKITYYDEDTKTKVKEVIPYQYGKKEGFYYLFFESGNIAVKGQYVFDQKVGVWEEFHNIPGVVVQKRQIQYPSNFYDWDFEPYIMREWNRNSQTVYVSPKIRP
ncbi:MULTISPECIES: hypothetical protein [Roseivirga]|uniref:toxin-antitoxin system YwqK family antitoxin n=1 Tax=Roseivirga TaxID=290180 RepID=UPI0025796072|nr:MULTISPECIES: hypothetical protein [Roseivirga]MEC7755118.1 hypothetical protein [Bacteroidota bacterium]|tara:strand:+ start:178 stop:1014 length:837 start_codon:yes stop_codon:yes gene_type:complete